MKLKILGKNGNTRYLTISKYQNGEKVDGTITEELLKKLILKTLCDE